MICFLIVISSIYLLKVESKAALDEKASEDNNKIIYLTFDDGPSYSVTNETLDILKEKNVKATFFIVGSKIQGKEDILKRIHNEGHSIGLHTYTHKYKKIYSTEEAFVEEMDRTNEEVKKVLGIEPKLIRFPSGSKPHLNDSLLDKLHAHNYRIFDWNACLSDGLNYNAPPDKLIKEAQKVIGKSTKVILLLHCDIVNKNTCKALPRIIDFYKSQGYEFKPITDETPEYYFRYKKSNKQASTELWQ